MGRAYRSTLGAVRPKVGGRKGEVEWKGEKRTKTDNHVINRFVLVKVLFQRQYLYQRWQDLRDGHTSRVPHDHSTNAARRIILAACLGRLKERFKAREDGRKLLEYWFLIRRILLEQTHSERGIGFCLHVLVCQSFEDDGQ